MKSTTFLLIFFTISLYTQNKQDGSKVEVLLIGTSHWANYQNEGLDVTQTNEIDILSKTYQKELMEIALKIADFKPDKVFVERTIEYQPKLDSLYNSFLNNNQITTSRNEIQQLGFRVAGLLNYKKVYAIDYRETYFPYDSLLTVMKSSGQAELLEQDERDTEIFEKEYNQLVKDRSSLKEIFAYVNSQKQRKLDLGWYLNVANKAGGLDNTVGSFLASEWMRRNMYIYSNIQKYIEKEDNRIMVLLGSSHMAVLELLIQYNPDWEIVELNSLLD
ncbi:DUF5694 domain-containing protein [Aquimarina sp. ERC-38]|uniref:DUF5694 domain-containing protein n=1 Tax=Aquimarina sp. ERC-38 TaxID=2949996 RepID=UPI0022481853|nr:DUF5694 domain-containing protein [Aquimarina sp. ERC-38]UZO81780.1 DUF5694 domain-containing protein [Aquimarina sp. ERC-38]